jgi:hypothetical protein
LPHRNDGFPQCLPTQVGAKPRVALVGDMGEEVTATGQLEAAIVGHCGRGSVPLLGCPVGGEEFGCWGFLGGALLRVVGVSPQAKANL